MIYLSNDEKVFEVHGHAGNGRQIITNEQREACAAITALTQGLLAALLPHGDYTHTIGPGFFTLSKEQMSRDAEIIFNGFMRAFEFVATGYPNQIQWI